MEALLLPLNIDLFIVFTVLKYPPFWFLRLSSLPAFSFSPFSLLRVPFLFSLHPQLFFFFVSAPCFLVSSYFPLADCLLFSIGPFSETTLFRGGARSESFLSESISYSSTDFLLSTLTYLFLSSHICSVSPSFLFPTLPTQFCSLFLLLDTYFSCPLHTPAIALAPFGLSAICSCVLLFKIVLLFSYPRLLYSKHTIFVENVVVSSSLHVFAVNAPNSSGHFRFG